MTAHSPPSTTYNGISERDRIQVRSVGPLRRAVASEAEMKVDDDATARHSPLNDAHQPEPLKPGTGLCLSGGGYRAMLFHVGVLWRLYEAARLRDLQRISSVSGGSITAGVLALAWPQLSFNPANLPTDFVPLVVDPIRKLAGQTLDAYAIIGGLLLPGTIADHVAASYRKQLFGDATLQSLPDQPRFVINATNVQTGALWRFSKPFMGDYRVGRVDRPTLSLATAVAASSAFPPVLSPMTIELDPRSFLPNSGQDLQQEPYDSRVVLTDGGVYDNLGLETVWKNYETVFVSDGGGKMQPEPEPHADWARHAYRVLDLVDNQVRSLRKRQVVGSLQNGERKGAYWGIRADITHYGPAAQSLPCPVARTAELANVATRLVRMETDLQERLINWGYAVCDVALRTHVDQTLPKPAAFPYPASKV
jgi:NTE family protein